MTADGAGARGAGTGDAAAGPGGSDAVREQEAREIAGDLGGFVLARSEVDRASARREDADWITAAWADDRTRVLVLDEGQTLIRFGDGAAELVLVPPAQAPEGVRFLLGKHLEAVAEVEMADDAVLRDFDTTDSLNTLPQRLRPETIG